MTPLLSVDDTVIPVLVELVIVTRFGDATVLADGIFNGCGQTLATGIACPVIVPTGNACPAGLLIAFT